MDLGGYCTSYTMVAYVTRWNGDVEAEEVYYER